MKKLIAQTLSSFLIGAVVLGVLLFLPAWTLNYWQAWVFIVVFMTSVNVIGLYLALKDPALLERRKKFGPAKEQSPAQKVAISIGVLALLGVLVFSAFAHRFGWSPVPTYGSLAGDALVALGLFINLLVFKENSYGGSTIETVDLHWPLCVREASNVRGRPHHDYRHSSRARRIVGSGHYRGGGTSAGLENQ